MSLFFFLVCTFSPSEPESLEITARFRFSPTSESADPERLRPLFDGERDPDLDLCDLACDGERDPDLRDRERDLRLDWDLAGEADLDRDPLRERAGLPLRDLFTGVPLRDRDLALPADACDRDRGLPERWDPAGLFEPERDLAEPERERCDPDGDCEREADRDLPDCRDPERDRLEPGELERLRFCGVPERERFACGEFDLESWCSKEYPGVGAACGVPLRLRLPRLESESEPDPSLSRFRPMS